MPINTKHPAYKEYEDIWEKCEDFYDGELTVKKKGTKYLPKLSGQSQAKYQAYKQRAVFYGAVARTVNALVGAVYRKEPAVALPSKLEYLRKDATGTGMSLVELAINLSIEVMKTGRAGLFVDRPVDGGNAYITVFDADDILNWAGDFVVLEDEKLVPDEKDKFSMKEVEGFRELTLDQDGNYVVNVWGTKANSKQYEIIQVIQPLKNGRPLTYIPFTCVSPSGLDFEVDRPPILDMVNVLEKHYQLSADYAAALHAVCVPTPYVTGIQSTDDFELNLGPDSAIILPTEGCKVGFLEFQGQGIGPVKDAITKLEGMLGALGARMVEATGSKTLIETAEGVRTREAVATAILGSIIASVEAALEKCLRWIADWDSIDTSEISVKLNRELVSSTIDANMLNAMLTAVQNGSMSFETLYHNLEEAGLTDPGVDANAEKERIMEGLIEKLAQTPPEQPQGIDNQQNL